MHYLVIRCLARHRRPAVSAYVKDLAAQALLIKAQGLLAIALKRDVWLHSDHVVLLPPIEARRGHFFSYFQLRRLPSAIHSIAVASRLSRVASVFASVIHSMYSFLQE